MKKLFKKYVELLRGRDRGTVAVTFLFALPILLFILSIMSQYALIINARMVLDHATAAAARSAMVSLPTDPQIDTLYDDLTPVDGVEFVNRAARMELESISPKALSGISDESTNVTEALQMAGFAVPSSYADHYSFAQAATTIEWQRLDDSGQPIAENQWQPADFAKAPGQRIQITVHYNFYLNAPGVKVWGPLLTGQTGTITIAGVNGYFLPMTSKYTVQLAHGRETQTDASGSPVQPAVQ